MRMRLSGFCRLERVVPRPPTPCFLDGGNMIPKDGKPVEDMEPFEFSELIETVFQVLASVASYQNSLFNERKGHYIYE